MDISDLPFEKTGLHWDRVGFAWGLMTASAWGLGFAWGFDLFCLGMDFFERVAWGGDFQGLVCLGTSILVHLLLGDLPGVDLLGAARQGFTDTKSEASQFLLYSSRLPVRCF